MGEACTSFRIDRSVPDRPGRPIDKPAPIFTNLFQPVGINRTSQKFCTDRPDGNTGQPVPEYVLLFNFLFAGDGITVKLRTGSGKDEKRNHTENALSGKRKEIKKAPQTLNLQDLSVFCPDLSGSFCGENGIRTRDTL